MVRIRAPSVSGSASSGSGTTSRLPSGDAPAHGADRHSDACQITSSQNVASHRLASRKQVYGRRTLHHDFGIISDFHAEICERNSRPKRIGKVRRRVERASPMRLIGLQAYCPATIQRVGIEHAGPDSSVESRDRRFQRVAGNPEFQGKLPDRMGLQGGIHRRNKEPNSFRIENRPGHLPRLFGYQASPNGATLGPEILALIVEPLAALVDHYSKRQTVKARHNAAVVARRARIDGNRVALRGMAYRLCTVRKQHAQNLASIERCAADEEIARRFAPDFLQPLEVRFKSSGGGHERTSADQKRFAAPYDARRFKAPVPNLDVLHLGLIVDSHAQSLSGRVIRVQERLSSAEKKRIRAVQMQSSSQRRLKTDAMVEHPLRRGTRFADNHTRELLIRLAAGDAAQIVEILVFRISFRGAPQIACVAAIASAKVLRGAFDDRDAGARLGRAQRRAQTCVAASRDQNIDIRNAFASQKTSIVTGGR